MTTTQLEYLIATVKFGSLNKAAKEYGTVYQNVASHIHTLETELGTTILVKTSKGSELTDKGKIIYDYALNFIDSYERLKREISDSEALVIGADIEYIHPKLSEFISRHSDIPIRLDPKPHDKLIEAVENNEIDCFIGYDRSYNGNIHYKELGSDKMVAAVSPIHKLANKDFFTWSDFSGETVHIGRFQWPTRERVIDCINEEANDCHLIYEYNSTLAIAEIISGQAIAILPQEHMSIFTGKIKGIPIDDEPFSYGIYYSGNNRYLKQLLDILSK